MGLNTGKVCEKIDQVEVSVFTSWGGLPRVNVVLDALPTYVLALFPIPSGVVQGLGKIRGPFDGKGTRKKELPT